MSKDRRHGRVDVLGSNYKDAPTVNCSWKTLSSYRPGGEGVPSIPCWNAWSSGNSKLGSGCQRVSNILTTLHSSMIYDSALGFISYIHELRMKSDREF
jgi:hypothetical protein